MIKDIEYMEPEDNCFPGATKVLSNTNLIIQRYTACSTPLIVEPKGYVTAVVVGPKGYTTAAEFMEGLTVVSKKTYYNNADKAIRLKLSVVPELGGRPEVTQNFKYTLELPVHLADCSPERIKESLKYFPGYQEENPEPLYNLENSKVLLGANDAPVTIHTFEKAPSERTSGNLETKTKGGDDSAEESEAEAETDSGVSTEANYVMVEQPTEHNVGALGEDAL